MAEVCQAGGARVPCAVAYKDERRREVTLDSGNKDGKTKFPNLLHCVPLQGLHPSKVAFSDLHVT